MAGHRGPVVPEHDRNAADKVDTRVEGDVACHRQGVRPAEPELQGEPDADRPWFDLRLLRDFFPDLLLSAGGALSHHHGVGLNRSRSDILGTVSVTPSPRWGVYGSVGSTFGRTDANSLRFQASGGITLNVRVWGRK